MRYLMLLVFALGIVVPAFAQDDEFDALLAEYVAEDDPGVVLLVSNEAVDYIGAAGLADLEAGTAIATDDQFRIASITKTYVAVVILQLVDEGALELDASIGTWLPADVIAGIPNSEEITLRQLLNMTSGVADYLANEDFWAVVESKPATVWTTETVLPYAYALEPDFAPGEGWEYSNTNYILIEVILEAVTGNSLAEELQTRIFEPLELADTSLEVPFSDKIVQGYALADDGSLVNVTHVNDGLGLADGGIISTAEDMATFILELMEGDLLSDAMWDEMMDVENNDEGYGLGIYEDEFGDAIVIGHTGGTGGFSSALFYNEDDGTVVVVLTNNFDSEIVEELLADAFDLASGGAGGDTLDDDEE